MNILDQLDVIERFGLKAQSIIQSKTQAEFDADETIQLAVNMTLVVIGEANKPCLGFFSKLQILVEDLDLNPRTRDLSVDFCHD